MSSRASSATFPIADVVLRILIVLNWLSGAAISGWLAVLLTFLLARVFAEGALLREDLDRTV